MRIRSIRPEFWSSEDIAALSWDDRLVFIGLWSYVDDNGVGRDVEKLITADLFPLEDDPRETLARVSRCLARLSERFLITRYTVSGKPFLHIASWSRHQKVDKPGRARYPLPTSEDVVIRETLAISPETPSISPPLEKGRRGEGEKGKELLSDGEPSNETEPDELILVEPTPPIEKVDLFPDFWSAYPRKDGKQDAVKAWRAVTKEVPAQAILAGVAEYHFPPERQFVPMPATWLRGRRWEDEGATVTNLRADIPEEWRQYEIRLERAKAKMAERPWEIVATPKPPAGYVPRSAR